MYIKKYSTFGLFFNLITLIMTWCHSMEFIYLFIYFLTPFYITLWHSSDGVGLTNDPRCRISSSYCCNHQNQYFPIVVHLLNKTRRHNINYNTFALEDPTLYQSSELFFSPESAEQLHMMHYPPQKSNPKTYWALCLQPHTKKMVLEQNDAKSVPRL